MTSLSNDMSYKLPEGEHYNISHIREVLMYHQLVEHNTSLEMENAQLRQAISEKDHVLEIAHDMLVELQEVSK